MYIGVYKEASSKPTPFIFTTINQPSLYTPPPSPSPFTQFLQAFFFEPNRFIIFFYNQNGVWDGCHVGMPYFVFFFFFLMLNLCCPEKKVDKQIKLLLLHTQFFLFLQGTFFKTFSKTFFKTFFLYLFIHFFLSSLLSFQLFHLNFMEIRIFLEGEFFPFRFLEDTLEPPFFL